MAAIAHAGLLAAAAALRQAVEQSASALAAPTVEGLLASEVAVGEALAALAPILAGHIEPGSDAERAALRQEIEATRQGLIRCRRLGTSLSEFIRIGRQVHDDCLAYGTRAGAAPASGGFFTRV